MDDKPPPGRDGRPSGDASSDCPPQSSGSIDPHPWSDHPLFDPERAARGEPYPITRDDTGLVPITDGDIAFDPVPRLRKRRNGWTPETQRAFILALEMCGCVSRSARAVGMTPKSAYRLLYSPGAESFAAAWDQAIARGVDALRLGALDRALNGAFVPVVRRGKLVRVEKRHDNRLAIALLSGRNGSVADNRERAASRRRYRMKLDEHRKIKAAEERAAAIVWAQHQEILDRIEAERANPPRRGEPRIRSL